MNEKEKREEKTVKRENEDDIKYLLHCIRLLLFYFLLLRLLRFRLVEMNMTLATNLRQIIKP